MASQAKITLKPKAGAEDGLSNGSGALVEVQFTAISDAGADDTTSLTITTARLSDAYGRNFSSSAIQAHVDASNGTLSIEEGNYIYLPNIVR